ncbi:MAG: Ribosomal RNA small subunit methyltransferase I [Candidatus Uhrbacteria bacterium GW2011_GWF2_39_13]|uniref:Ribosomal RNA small subunit methyltransferase I n=1 Tax=Candidatus Uhrbacteria bacterium GW2011_GWF2_39_13 TaxID=1618995 RepID=A0A0G0MW47_9BACT|nr:MAG: Ribosomal RNA small subunit methyltransferase I [Candidatus Uhrbacteria bacterium GW2011_GWF2_39_13]HAU66440.1 16S rRNA (cytidine(1402)-2'-O)-methyltransferase [Candidatus Uhrbacteria bacterium]
MATLFVVATPIGNLSDLSERAKKTLSCVQTILCEDTRVTGKLLSVYGIHVPLLSYHQHSGQFKTQKIIELLEEQKDLALVTDAGTPAISDPGGKLVEELLAHFGDNLTITPIPGPSALIAALSIAGVSADEFTFLGFPPHKKGRQTFFDHLTQMSSTVVIYESTHRILKTLDEIHKRTPERHLIVCRELTKMYETIYRGSAQEVTVKLQSTSIKGEFVLVFSPL